MLGLDLRCSFALGHGLSFLGDGLLEIVGVNRGYTLCLCVLTLNSGLEKILASI